VAQHQGYLGSVRRFAGAQDDRHRLGRSGLVDVDRLKAAAVIVRVEQRELLSAMNPVLGVVDVEHDTPGYLLETVAEHSTIAAIMRLSATGPGRACPGESRGFPAG
jgi:hypothetical protein